jgi:hypothetical protein
MSTLASYTARFPVVIRKENPMVAGTAILALIAYPEKGGAPKRDKFMKACLAWMTKRVVAIRRAEGRPKGTLKVGLNPELTGTDNKFIQRQIEHGLGRIEVRLEAVEIFEHLAMRRAASDFHIMRRRAQKLLLFVPLRQSIRLQRPAKGLRLSRAKASIEAVVRDLYSEPGSDITKPNVDSKRRHIWKASLPILHLAICINEVLLENGMRSKERRKWKLLVDLIANPDWMERVVSRAEFLRAALPQALSEIRAGNLIPIFLA